MPKEKLPRDRLRGAAVVKMSFRLRDAENSPAFLGIYPGLLRDLKVTDEEVEAYIQDNLEDVKRAARGRPDDEL